jgi:hypothetical protein
MSIPISHVAATVNTKLINGRATRGAKREKLPVINLEAVLAEHFAQALAAVCKRALAFTRSDKAKAVNRADTFLELTEYDAEIVRDFADPAPLRYVVLRKPS